MDIVHSINLTLSTNFNLESYYDKAQRLKNQNSSHSTLSHSCSFSITDSDFIFPTIDPEYEEKRDPEYEEKRDFEYEEKINMNKCNIRRNIKQNTYGVEILDALHKAVMYEGNMDAGKELFNILPSKVIQATIECDITLQNKLQQITQNVIRMFRRNGIEGYLHIANYYLKISSDITKTYSNKVNIIDHELFKAAYSLIIAINSVLKQLSFDFDQDGEIFNFVFHTSSGQYVQIVSNGDHWVVNPEFLTILKKASMNNNMGECLSDKISIMRLFGFRGYLDYLIYTAFSSIDKLQSYTLFDNDSYDK